MQKNYPKKRKLNKLKASLLLLMMVCFASMATAQKAQNRNIFMQNGSTTLAVGETVNFYDSHGPSCASYAEGNKMEVNYWDRWYANAREGQTSENFTYTFNAPEGYDVKVVFKRFTAYGETEEGNYQSVPPVSPYNCTEIGEWALRINDDELFAYEGTATIDAKLIGSYTGNTESEFSIIARDAITFKFVVNQLFREEGWAAEVTTVAKDNFAPTAPFIRRSTCSDLIELVPTTLGSALYYTLGANSNPNPGTPYNNTPIDWPEGQDIIVKAIAMLNGESSPVAVATFEDDSDRIPTINNNAYKPTVTRVAGENKMSIKCPSVPEGLNETFFVSYTTDGQTPSRNVGTKVYFTYVSLPGVPSDAIYYSDRDRTYVFDWNTPNTTFKAKVFAFSCHNDEMESPVGEGFFENVFIPKPEINVTGTYDQQTNPDGLGNGTITCSLDGATIYYTLDGSEPTISSTLHGTSPIILSDVPAGTTIKAMAYKSGTGYTSSPVVTFLYVPTTSNGQSQNGVYDKVVLLDDREDHNWSYYSDGDQPIHSLKPADVKIMYLGNGKMYTSTTATPSGDLSDASGVQVSASEKANQFVYLKTLENANPEGSSGTNQSYPYTLIPNPFSKRPTFTSGGTTYYTGFYGWRVKSLSDGLTIQRANGNTVNVGGTIDPEEEIQFVTNNSKGNEVEFEALWARAFVVRSNTTNGLQSSVGYERNFVYLSDNTLLRSDGNYNAALSVPVTYTTLDPATGSGTIRTITIRGGFTCGANTKFENATLEQYNNTDQTFTANNHDLIMGRGLTGTIANIHGIEGAYNGDLKYTLRVESGNYSKMSFVDDRNNGAHVTVSGRVQVKGIMGSDYDRAKNDDDKLHVSNGGTFYFSRDVEYHDPRNKDVETFNCVIKSGSYQEHQWDGTDGNSNNNFYCGPNHGAQASYPGVRNVTIEGGQLANMNGGQGSDDTSLNNETNHASTNVVNFNARIKGGTFHGCVFGGASDNPSNGSKRIVVTGGTIKGWIAGGANGTGTGQSGSTSQTNGNSYIYVGGNSTIGSTDPITINETQGGNIFGAGRGRTTQRASIDISNVVVADNTTVYQNVYGAGFCGYITNTANVFVLGGTVKQNVYGGGYNHNQSVGGVAKIIPTTNIYAKGGEVQGNIYGGSHSSGTVTNSHVTMSGGEATNVFGGGLGENTVIGTIAVVNVSGGELVQKEVGDETIGGNIYGGGERGTVGTASSANASTDVTFSGGTVMNVFGAGLGTKNSPDPENPQNPTANANIYGNTVVTINGGTVGGSVFGGGENGSVGIGATGKKSTVVVNGGTVNGSVFGGGSEGFTNGSTVVNMKGGSVKASVFGGALGKAGIVYINGSHTVNVMGGDNGIPEISGSVYGGSRLANDGDDFTLKGSDFNTSTKTQLSSVVNISGGRIREHVYASGYYGQCFGSVYVNIGANAITNTTNALGNNTNDKLLSKNRIFIEGSVWAGSDWGVFDGTFTAPSITGHSNVIVDGTDYNVTATTYTTTDYLGIGMSILGCGTSGDAGKQNRNLLLRNYGTPIAQTGDPINPYNGATREFKSIQRFKNVTFDNAHVSFEGQGKVNSLNTTEKYSLYSIANDEYTGNVYVANGSTLVMNNPCTELNSFRSVTCSDPYLAAPAYVEVTRDILFNGATGGNTDNKIRVNGGSYVEVKYNKAGTQTYGVLQGYFHLMADDPTVLNGDATCAYARPKKSITSPVVGNDYQNPNDGGFLSYDTQYNTWDSNGELVGSSNYQLPYENHAPTSKSDTEYFRVWRFGGNHHNVDGIITVQQVLKPGDEGYQEYRTVDVTIQLPAWRTNGSYYRFDRVGAPGSYFTNIDYGIDVMTFNAANTGNGTGNTWMYYDENGQAQVSPAASSACPEISKLGENPDMNFGLIIMPGDGMTPAADTPSNYIICSTSDRFIAENMQYGCSANGYNTMPTVTFRLTYKNDISSNTTWDPVTIPLVQCYKDGTNEVVKEYVNINLVVNTMTEITSDFKTQVYAIMNNGSNGHATTLQTIVLPTFTLNSALQLSNFTLVKAEFTPGVALEGGTTVNYCTKTTQPLDINSFGLTMEAVLTPDNSDDWRNVQGEIEAAPGNGSSINKKIAESGGRMSVALGFNLYYSEVPQVQEITKMGTVVFTVEFDNYKNGDTNHKGRFTVTVDVYRKGPGVNFYVDGVNGVDEVDNAHARGKYPNFAAKSVEYVLSRLGYTAGDNIFIVNTVDVKKALRYDGSKKQDNVNIWRYPGNHKLRPSAEPETPPTPIIDNTNNEAFKGLLFDLKSGAQLSVIGTKIDGMYAEAVATTHDQHIFPSLNLPEGAVLFDGKAEAPIFKVNDGAKLTLNSITSLQNNYNNASAKADEGNAGGVYVASGAILAMNQNTRIISNYNATVGGVYMDGSMIVSDNVVVYNNMKNPNGEQSNVWLTKGTEDDRYKAVQIGDANMLSFGPLAEDAHIGIDKDYGSDAYTMDDYLPVVFTETTNTNYVEDYLEDPYQSNRISLTDALIVHDKAKFRLEKYMPDNYLYWLGTWVTFQDWNPKYPNAEDPDYDPDDMDYTNIDTPEKLAWLISMVNGENGATANDFAGETIYIKDDISMDGHIWVPIGTDLHPFKGTFEGNGHVITDMYGSLVQSQMGMFGNTVGATIQNAVVSTDFTGSNDNLGTVIGTMNGGTLCNVEGAGSISNKLDNCNMGGLVGNNVGGTIHSVFAVADMIGGSKMGGLVGKNTGNLYNAYSNVDFAKLSGQTSQMTVAGLVYENTGYVQNCYVIEGSHNNGTFYPFAYSSNGNIDFCYAAKPAEGTTVTYVGTGTQPTTHGTYDVVKGRKEIGYMYGDNAVDADNDYVADEITYGNGYNITKWPGLLSSLNQWVKANPKGLNPKPTTWFRSTSSYKEGETVKAYINGDLPVLGFPSDNSMATEDGKFLYYGSNVDANGLDNLFTVYNGKTANMFLYGNATDVTLGNGNNKLFINEDAVLLQKATDDNTPDITATVGVTFDNSCGDGTATNTGAPLTYDWHFMSTPLQNAPINATYGATTGFMNPANIESMDANCYFPNGLFDQNAVTWDFYTYSEEFHHWVNLKRTDHYYQENGQSFTYVNETSFEPGKGYMMAISQDSYMNSTGLLNNDDVKVTITNMESQHLDTEYNKGWNLVGNPYQAYLDLEALFADDDNKNEARFAYVYDADENMYVPFVENASNNPHIVKQFVHQHQAFFVHSEKESTRLTFKPGMAKVAEDAPYFRGSDRVNYPLLNLFAENTKGNRDLAVIEFNRPELGGATKVNGVRNANFQVAASLEGHRYGLVFTPEGTEKVPVHFTTEENGTFTLTWETLHGDFTSLLLVDNMTGTITDMLRADSYTFDATTDDYASRFYITYAVTAVDEYNEGDGTFAFFDGSEWVVNGKGQLDVVDVQGRTLYSERLVNDKNRVSLNGVSAGVYLLRVSDGTNTMVQKIVVR